MMQTAWHQDVLGWNLTPQARRGVPFCSLSTYAMIDREPTLPCCAGQSAGASACVDIPPVRSHRGAGAGGPTQYG